MPSPIDRSLLMPFADDAPRTAILAALCVAAMAASLIMAPGAGGLLAAGLVPVLVAIAAWDARLFLIPDTLSAAGALLGLAAAALTAGGTAADMTSATLLAVARGAVLAGLFLAIRTGYRLLRGHVGLGLGDVKLAGVAGIWLEPAGMVAAVEIAALSALAAIGVRHVLSGRTFRPRARLPLGLFLAPAIWIAWVLERTVMPAIWP